MLENCADYESLMKFVNTDKEISGAIAENANRYPIRFVLFDNFQDYYKFVDNISNGNTFRCTFKNIRDWLNIDYPDMLLTSSELTREIEQYAISCNTDCIIIPFSELTRFYTKQEFETIIRTIRGIENKNNEVVKNRRIYIPIVGLENKMSNFENDSQCTIWHLNNTNESHTYKLIITNGTDYGVNDPQSDIVHNVKEWLNVWTKQSVKSQIISTSPSLYANAKSLCANEKNTTIDNAFSFFLCSTVYDFLVKGLNLDFGNIKYKKEDNCYWEQLSKEITDPQIFKLETFFNTHFNIDKLSDYKIFLSKWFEYKDKFNRWLLITFYNEKFHQKGYICQVVNNIQNYTDPEFLSVLALLIFKLEAPTTYIEERKYCLQQYAKNYKLGLNQDDELTLYNNLTELATSSDHQAAIQYFSPLTKKEKELSIEWFAKGLITKDCFKTFFPEMYDYLGNNSSAKQQWINTYFDEYKLAKIRNEYTSKVSDYIKEKNESNSTFNRWYQELSTTKTILSNRHDIDVYYWIDGLGADWIPYIQERLVQKQNENIFLNEIYLARALYPTTTENNKKELSELSDKELNKCGDLDEHAHQRTNKYPTYILEEFEIINKAIDKIVSEYNGKKIGIVSDHGLTALSQLCDGLNLAGVTSDHNGRLANSEIGILSSNYNYIVCDDEKTICALRHQSLCGKVPSGQSAHGGCTPEEIIVPIFIISSQREDSHWTAKLTTKTITEIDPTVEYHIEGTNSIDTPYILYNGKRYNLTCINGDIFKSEKLALKGSENKIKLVIDDKQQTDTIIVKLGAEENDLFNF
jgi:hypothetical protein